MREINTHCYSTRSVETTSTVTFHVAATLRMQRLRVSDRGRLSATESACVLRAIRQRVVDFGEARVGGFTFELANENVRVELDHQPLCAP
jgi:hypothetical protein